MTLTLLLIGGAAVVLAAVFVMVRAYEATSPALAGETTAVALADPGADTLIGHGREHGSASHGEEWQLTTVAELHDAEDLLDCLESRGYSERELLVLGNSCFAVRWR